MVLAFSSSAKRSASTASSTALKHSCLIVEVDDAVWQRQLFTLQHQILRNLNDILGQGLVLDLEFRIGVPRRMPQRAQAPSRTADEADLIPDPVFRSLYIASRKRALA